METKFNAKDVERYFEWLNDLRDGGSLETRAANVAYWHQWPDEYDFLMQKWDEFLSA